MKQNPHAPIQFALKVLIICLFVFISSLSGCIFSKCTDEPSSINDAKIYLVYQDRHGNPMLMLGYQKYKLDEIYILSPDSTTYLNFEVNGGGSIDIRYFDSNDNLSYDFFHDKTYYIHLPHVGSVFVEVDTLRLTYQYAKGECVETETQNMTVYFNGELLDEGGKGHYSRAFYITKD